MRKIKKSHVFIVLLLCSLVCWITQIFWGRCDNNQFSIFFFKVNNFFADTLNVIGYSSERDPYFNMYNGLAEKPYPPLTYCIMYLFSRICVIPDNYLNIFMQPQFLIIYIILLCFVMILLHEIIKNAVAGNNIFKVLMSIVLVFSFPVLFTLERGNTLILTIICILFFIFNYDSDNRITKEISLMALAIAAAFKLTPAIFGLILLYEKKWKESLRCIVYGIIAVILPFAFLKRDIVTNIFALKNNIGENLTKYSDAEGCGFVASAYKYGKMFCGESFVVNDSLHLILRIMTVVLCLMMMIGGGIYTKKKWIKIMGLSLINIIWPSHSGVYNVIYMLPATIMFFNDTEEDKKGWVIMFLMLPIYWMHYDFVSNQLGYNFVLPLLSIVMAIISVREIIGYYKKG